MCAPLKGRKSERTGGTWGGVKERRLERRDRGRDRDARAVQRNEARDEARRKYRRRKVETSRIHARTHARTHRGGGIVHEAQRVGQTEVRSTKRLAEIVVFSSNIAIFSYSLFFPELIFKRNFEATSNTRVVARQSQIVQICTRSILSLAFVTVDGRRRPCTERLNVKHFCRKNKTSSFLSSRVTPPPLRR